MQLLNDILNQMAPYMVIAVYVAAAILLMAIVSFLTRILWGAGNGLLKCCSRLLVLLGVVFLIYQVLDIAAGTGVTNTYSFHEQPFWGVALIILIPGILFRLMAALRPTRG